MPPLPNFETIDAHCFFSAHCYNEAWRLMGLAERSTAQDEELLALAYASYWHWIRREDCLPVNRSIALWLLSRVHAVLGNASQARDYGERCLSLSRSASLPPFYLGYAHEAMARACRLAGDQAAFQMHLASARACLAQVVEDEERELLGPDLDEMTAATG